MVPAPQQGGRADYTKEIAELIAFKTGACVLDIVACEPHISVYDQRLYGGQAAEPVFYLIGDYPEDGTLFFVDNVISTGHTFFAIEALFDRPLVPLVYAVDFSRLEDLSILG